MGFDVGDTLSKGERTQQAIIDGALRLFLENGFSGTSMRQIANAAGLNAVGGVYNHFATKEDIFVAVIQTYHPVKVLAGELGTVEGETLEDLFRSAAYATVKALEIDGKPMMLRLLFVEVVEFDGRHFGVVFDDLMPKIAGFVQRLQPHMGRLREPNPMALMRAFFGAILGYSISQMALDHIPGMAAQFGSVDDVVDAFLYGIVKPEDGDV